MTAWWFFVNFFVLSLILAIFEISTEKDKGWGTGLGSFWGKKFFVEGVISRVCEKHYFTLYHLVMFGLIVPLILYGEHLWFKMPLFFLVASWIEIAVIEDFLWFILNWYFPGSLRKLLAGEIWWHTVYWRIGNIRLPRFYFLSSFWATGFLLLQYYIDR